MFSHFYTKRLRKIVFLPVLDFAMLVCGAVMVYFIRYRFFLENSFGLSLSEKNITGWAYLQGASVLAILILLVYSFLGLYSFDIRQNWLGNIAKLAFGIFLVLSLVISFYYFNEYDRNNLPSGIPLSRFILGVGGFLTLYCVYLGRAILWAVEQALLFFKIGKVNLLIMGGQLPQLETDLYKRSDVDTVLTISEVKSDVKKLLTEYIFDKNVTELYILSQGRAWEAEAAFLCERYKVRCLVLPVALQNYQALKMSPVAVGSRNFLEMKYTNLEGWRSILKRLCDIFFSIILIILFSWLFVLVAVLIKLDSPGNILYGNKRVGPNGKEFTLWKFRRLQQKYCTSSENQHALRIEDQLIKTQNLKPDNILYKIGNDPRFTRVGKVLEKYSLDELPQLINVLLGDMSLVGPRPHQPREVAKYKSHHHKVLNIKPGITGLAQVSGRSDLSFESEVSLDWYYVEHWSFLLDIKILLLTPKAIILASHKS